MYIFIWQCFQTISSPSFCAIEDLPHGATQSRSLRAAGLCGCASLDCRRAALQTQADARECQGVMVHVIACRS